MDPLGNARIADVGKIEARLAELWRDASTEDVPVVRACALNLIVACDEDPDALESATRTVAGVSESAPGRALVIAPSNAPVEEGGKVLDVFVNAHCHRSAGGGQVCTEQVTLDVRKEGAGLVPQTILQLLVEDMPVHTLWRRALLTDDPWLDQLARFSDCFIVNSSASDEPHRVLRELLSIASKQTWRGHVADVTWARTEPWREALASFFDLPERRLALSGVTRLTLVAGGSAAESGMTAAGAYVAGWLASRLGWLVADRGSGWTRPDGRSVGIEYAREEHAPEGEIASIRLDAEDASGSVAFLVERVRPDSDRVRLTVHTGNREVWSHTIRLPSRDETALLCGILQHTGRDEVFEAALLEAARIVQPG